MKTMISFVLDRSGSMSSIRNDVVGGLNQFIEGQKQGDGDCSFRLIQFDSQGTDVVIDTAPVASVKTFTDSDFVPRASTPLLDAIGTEINRLGESLAKMPEAERAEKVVMVILTDGHENQSTEFTREQVFKMISHQREQYQWEFVFLGANQDAITEGASLGTVMRSSMTYAQNSKGYGNTVIAASAAINRVRSGEDKEVSFTEAERLSALQS